MRIFKILAATVFVTLGVSNALSAAPVPVSFEGSVTEDPFCAQTFSFCEGSVGILRGPLVLTIPVPTLTLGDGTFAFTAYGDFNLDSEFIVLEAEGFAFGNFLNTNPADDIFADDGWRPGWEDRGNEYGVPRVAPHNGNVCDVAGCVYQPPRVGVAIIPQATLQTMIADSFFTLSIWLSGNVSNGPILDGIRPDDEEFFAASIAFDTLADVPLPPGLAFLGGAIAVFGVARRKRG